ncbi:GDSL-type esterase/lipase family protein [Thalassotalea agariperforans]
MLKKGDGLIAAPRQVNFDWMSIQDWFDIFHRHQKITKEDNVDVLFLGDSLTENWDVTVVAKYFADYSLANFGIGGDHTGNLLWRLQNMSYEKFSPKLIVLQIGVNNIGHLNEDTEVIVQGINKVLQACLHYMPTSKVLLYGLFPFEQLAKHINRQVVIEVNQKIEKFADNEQVFYQDDGALFLSNDGTISTEIMPDFLHPSAKGYEIWAQSLSQVIKRLLPSRS